MKILLIAFAAIAILQGCNIILIQTDDASIDNNVTSVITEIKDASK